MTRSSLLARRAVPAVAGAAAVLLLAACGSDGPAADDGGSSGTSSAGSSSAEATESAEPTDEGAADEALATGLLPADAFGPSATVTPLSAEELQSQEQAGLLEGVTVTPEACAAAVQSTQTKTDAYDAIAAQVATTDAGTATVQLLTEGGPVDGAIATARDNVAVCSEATISSPELGTATIAFATIDVPDLGDDSAAVLYTTTVTAADGTVASVPIVLGLVQDGQRMLTLITTGTPDQPVDQAAFVALLERAYQHQADTLD